MVDYSTRALLSQLKMRAMLPENDASLTDTELMRLASVAYSTMVSPFLRVIKEEYNVETEVIPLISGTFVDQFVKIPIPSRAEAGSLRNVFLRQRNGSPQGLISQMQVPYIPPEDLGSTYTWNNSSRMNIGLGSIFNRTVGYTVENDDIKMVANSSSVDPNIELAVKYYLRAGQFIPIDQPYNPFSAEEEPQNAFQITTVDTSSHANFWYVTGSAYVTDTKFADSTTVEVDIFGAKPPFRTRVVNASADCTNDTSQVCLTFEKTSLSSSYTLNNTFMEYPAVGDWVSLTNEMVVMKMPVELHEMLIQATLVEIYNALGDVNKAKEASEKLNIYMLTLRNLVAPRVQGATRVVLNSRSPLRKGRQ